jgi:transposase-like protein
MDIRAVFIDGKRFRKHGVIKALGVAIDGRKFVLGIFQADTENSSSCLELINDLERRGLPSSGLLFIVDGGSGLNKALGAFRAIRDAKDMAEPKFYRTAWRAFYEARIGPRSIAISKRKNLKRFFSTTNAIESLNSMIEEYMRRVKLWRDSEHFQRWLATYCLASEKRMRRIRGHASVAGLWVRLRTLTERQDQIDSREEVA